MKFYIERSTNYQYYFRIVADNHETLCHSETYTSKQSAKNAIDIIKREAATALVIDNA